MRHILFVVPYTPNVIRVRPYNLIRGLAARGNAVTVATLWSSAGERADLQRLRSEGIEVIAAPLARRRALWNCLRALPRRVPLQAVYCWQPEFSAQLPLSNGRRSFDVVHVEHLRGARYGLALRSQIENSKLQIPVVWDSVDCISYLFEQAAARSGSLFGKWVTRLELGRTRRYEGWLVGQFDQVLVTSAVDKEALEALAGRRKEESRISVLPNGVDLSYFGPGDEPREPATLVISGKMSYHANVTAVLHLVHDILPLVWRERPDAKVWIAGKDPSREIRQLAESESRIVVTGTVPDIRPYLQKATIAVVPLVYGAGTQFKVLEAAACQTPVVATSIAAGGLQARAGEHLLVADGAKDFAQAVLGLLDDAARCRELGQAGRRYVEVYHDWSSIVEQLEMVYAQVGARVCRLSGRALPRAMVT